MPVTPSLDDARRAAQLAFLASGAELEVGSAQDCPLPLAKLAATRGDEPWVVGVYGGGLTARVFRVRAQGRDWTLKIARRPALVKNVDGQTSFLNELQRRADFVRLKAQGAPGLEAIVDTAYASLRHGVLLSPWIDGEVVQAWDERRLGQLIAAALGCAANGLFEWDLSPGNVLDDGRQVRLFDFGYMYRFDPLTQFNSAGDGLDAPQFHPVERFETRNLFGVLMELEATLGEDAALALFRTEKVIAVEACRRHRAGLAARGATAAVLQRLDGIVARWSAALGGDLGGLYLAEGWRSHGLDLDDDLGGQTCTPMTLRRADWMLRALQQHHDALVGAGALAGAELAQGWPALVDRLRARRAQAERWQVAPG
jgi:hypothetical protein